MGAKYWDTLWALWSPKMVKSSKFQIFTSLSPQVTHFDEPYSLHKLTAEARCLHMDLLKIKYRYWSIRIVSKEILLISWYTFLHISFETKYSYFDKNLGGLWVEWNTNKHELLTNTTRPQASPSIALEKYQTGDEAYIKSGMFKCVSWAVKCNPTGNVCCKKQKTNSH